VIGVLGDKDLAGMAGVLAHHFPRAVATTPPHPVRARPAAETAAALTAAGMEVVTEDDVTAACRRGRDLCRGEGWLFVTGSLFTVGAALEALEDTDIVSGAGNRVPHEG
jgi:folylpolyglutamate synthase/dihydropteroate synthase